MNIDAQHPLYMEFFLDWEQMRHTYRGQRIVKEQGFRYLPASPGMVEDGVNNTTSDGYKNYQAYLTRARFPELVKEAVESMLGVMHHKPPVIELPAKLEPMREAATLRGESLEMLLRNINEEQLICGRIGLLLEVPPVKPGGKAPLPVIALYDCEDVINWDEIDGDHGQVGKPSMVVIDESEERREGFTWKNVRRHRVLSLGALVDTAETEAIPQVYRVGVFEDDADFDDSQMAEPSIAGRKLDEVPFRFVNVKSCAAAPDEPPLLGLSNLSLSIYRGEADHRQSLFNQGQDTFVTIGAEGDEDGPPLRIGTGAHVNVPMGGDAKFIGVESSGLSEQREALKSDYQQGNQKAGALLEAVSRAAESGEALRVRVSARTASLNQVALTGAFALEDMLKLAAVWVGADPEEVSVTPNVDFVADIMGGEELTKIMAAKQIGAPISLLSIHNTMAARGMTEMQWEEELAQMQKEIDEALVVPLGEGGTDESKTNDPEPDPVDDEDRSAASDDDDRGGADEE